MLVTVTFDITTPDQKETVAAETYFYVDIEVTDDEYKKIGNSFDTHLYRGMFEDMGLSDICDRCRAALSDWGFEEELGDDILIRFDYPVETRIDHAECIWTKSSDEDAEELIPPNAKLLDNEDGTYTVWWPGKCA